MDTQNRVNRWSAVVSVLVLCLAVFLSGCASTQETESIVASAVEQQKVQSQSYTEQERARRDAIRGACDGMVKPEPPTGQVAKDEYARYTEAVERYNDDCGETVRTVSLSHQIGGGSSKQPSSTNGIDYAIAKTNQRTQLYTAGIYAGSNVATAGITGLFSHLDRKYEFKENRAMYNALSQGRNFNVYTGKNELGEGASSENTIVLDSAFAPNGRAFNQRGAGNRQYATTDRSSLNDGVQSDPFFNQGSCNEGGEPCIDKRDPTTINQEAPFVDVGLTK